MALLESFYSTDLINLLMFDTPLISSSSAAATPLFAAIKDSSDATLVLENSPKPQQQEEEEFEEEAKVEILLEAPKVITRQRTRDNKVVTRATRVVGARNVMGPQSGTRKKRKRRPRVCKNKEEAENQRMTHIAVERNRRRQMNEHLAVLRSLMPESFIQRGDQASIVGGAVEFVKDLEHLLQNLEAHKLQFLQRGGEEEDDEEDHQIATKFSQISSFFFLYPQITRPRSPNSKTEAIADIEVTIIETHANIRILSRRNPRQLSRLVSGFHTLHLTILHLRVTTLEPLVLYSISAKVEEVCQLTSVDDISGAVHHMLNITDDEGREAK